MFNKNFFPTPEEIIKKMYENKRYSYILEPSAGKGNIVDFIQKNSGWNCDKEIDVLEIELELQSILHEKNCNVVGSDFLQYQTGTEYDLIIMNPPFDNGVKHLIKAISLAEKQCILDCDIVCLLNAETIDNPYSDERKHLSNLLIKHGATLDYLESAFKGAERSSNVRTVLIKLNVKSRAHDSENLYFKVINEIDNSVENEPNYITTALSTQFKKNEVEKRVKDIKLLCRLYNEHLYKLKNFFQYSKELELYTNIVANNDDTKFNTIYLESDIRFQQNNLKNDLKTIRSYYWRRILNTDEFAEILTSESRERLLKQINQTSALEINEENIYKLMMSLYSNRTEMLSNTLVLMFEKLTENHMSDFSKNIHYYNGWKTNNAFKIKNKVIFSSKSSLGEHNLYSSWSDEWVEEFRDDTVRDLIKALQLLANYELENTFIHLGNGLYENNTLKVQCYKKGTNHVTFKDLELLDQFNIFVGQKKNWLPDEEEIKEDVKAKEYMAKEFSNSQLYLR